MAEETTTDPTAQTTSDATAQNTDTQTSGAGTDTAQQTQAQTEKTFTQADVDRILQTRLKSAVKAELKKMAGDGDDKPNVEDLQRQLSERDTKLRSYEASAAIRSYLTDARHKLTISSEDLPTVEELVTNRLEYDDDGKPANLKEAIEEVKARSPKLFANPTPSINANNGRNGAVVGADMNSIIRGARGYN